MASPLVITPEQFKQFHLIDRELYTILVMNLWRDPAEAMQVMGLWLWLERVGCNNVVWIILSLPVALINALADEAVTCLNCINNDQFPYSFECFDIPMMQSVMEPEISLKYFHDNRLVATQRVLKIVSEVCIRALTDILHKAMERNVTQSLVESRAIPSFQQSLAQPAHPQIGLSPNDIVQPLPEQSLAQPVQPQIGLSPNDIVQPLLEENGLPMPPDDRTLFVTFSKGYRVLEWEVRDFFKRNYGDCIESLHMQEAHPHEQPLFARIIFHSAATTDVILNGMDKAKFTINGKHVWARKFVPKRPRSSLPPLKILSLFRQRNADDNHATVKFDYL